MKPDWDTLIIQALSGIDKALWEANLDVRQTKVMRRAMTNAHEGIRLVLEKAYYLGQQEEVAADE